MKIRQTVNSAINILNDSEIIFEARKGINRNRIIEVMSITGLTVEEMGQYIHITPRTLQRKDYKEMLPTDISEKVLLIQNLYARGSQVFGSLNTFKDWMNTPNITLEGAKPKDLMDTYSGIEYLKQELGRLEQGFNA